MGIRRGRFPMPGLPPGRIIDSRFRPPAPAKLGTETDKPVLFTCMIGSGETVRVSHDRWRFYLFLTGIAVIAVLLLFGETVRSMAAIWYRSKTYSHGFLVLPISLYLIWTRRRQVAALQPTPNPWALILLAALALGWLLADLTAVPVAEQIALTAMLPALVWLLLGSAVTRRVVFPLLFLFFAVPVGEALVPPLQDFTALFAVKSLDLVGVPVVLEGRFIFLPSGAWEVAEACSGVRYLIASAMLGCLYAHLVYRSWGRRIAFLAASLLVPILANGLRAFGIILLGHLSTNQFAGKVDHVIYGAVFFSVTTFVLFAAGWRWREGFAIASSAGEGRLPAGDTPARVTQHSRPTGQFSAVPAVLCAAAGVALLALAPLSAQALAKRPRGESPGQIAIMVSPPWRILDSRTDQWKPHFVEPSSELLQTYASGDQRVYLYVAQYAGEQNEGKLVSSMNTVYDGEYWVRVGESSATVLLGGKSLPVRETLIRSPQASRLVWSGYWVDGRLVRNPYWAKLLQAKARLSGGAGVSAAIAVAADFAPNREEAVSVLEDFLRHAQVRESTARGSP